MMSASNLQILSYQGPDRRERHDRRALDRRGLVLVHGGLDRRIYGAEAVECIRRAVFQVPDLKAPIAYRIACGRARPVQMLLQLTDDLVPRRRGGREAAALLSRGVLSLANYVNETSRGGAA
jgi:hypothetical protein